VMAWRRGRSDEARVLFERAIDEFERAGSVRPAARAAAALAEIDFNEGKPLDAVDRLRSALETLAHEEADEDVALVTAQLGRFLVLAGSVDEGGPYLEQALALSEAFDLPEIFVDALTSKSLSLSNAGRLGECEILLEGSIARAEAQDLPRAAARALNNLGVLSESADRFSETLAITERALAHAARAGDHSWELMLRAGNVSSLVLVGRWGEAIETADELAQSPHGPQVASMLGCALEIDCRRGDVERAKERLSSIMQVTEDPQVRASQALFKAIVLRAEREPAAALEELQPALDAREALGIRFLTVKLAIIEELECASALGDAARVGRVLESIDELRPGERPPLLTAHAARFRARRTTDASEAEREFRAAAEIFREHDLVFWLAVTQLEHGEWLNGQDRSEEAEPLLAEAHERFERLEATPWIHRAAEARLRGETAEALV
jgi:tetratricopeptide (TPR) repeat protein